MKLTQKKKEMKNQSSFESGSSSELPPDPSRSSSHKRPGSRLASIFCCCTGLQRRRSYHGSRGESGTTDSEQAAEGAPLSTGGAHVFVCEKSMDCCSISEADTHEMLIYDNMKFSTASPSPTKPHSCGDYEKQDADAGEMYEEFESSWIGESCSNHRSLFGLSELRMSSEQRESVKEEEAAGAPDENLMETDLLYDDICDDVNTSAEVSASSAQTLRCPLQSSRPRSASWSSESQTGCDRTFRRAVSLPDVKSERSFEEFTPDFTEDGDEYSFHCSGPGLFRCSVTGLLFHMQGGGDVFYRLVPWNRSLLAPHHKKPAGPLFDIKCPQQCVSQLHLPHCEVPSSGGCGFLSVVHLNDDGVEFIPPQQITDTHVIINITGFSAYGNVKEEDSPPHPVQALVLLVYRPPEDPDLTSFLSVMLLPRNIVMRDVQRTRKKLFGREIYIETSPHCKLRPKQLYTLSTDPEDNLVLVQPTEAEFDEAYNNNYFPTFKLLLKDSSSSHSVWERRVYLQSAGVTRSCGSTGLNLPSDERLSKIRSGFIDGVSGPVLSSLLDKLLEKKVLTDAERETAEEKPSRRDRAGLVIDTVRRKGEAASSEMIQTLCDIDLFLCKHLGLS